MTDKILIDRSVVEQALEALEYYEHRRLEWDYADEQAITALRAALEQQVEQEPVAWMCRYSNGDGTESRGVYIGSDLPDYRKRTVLEAPVPFYTHPHPRQPLTDQVIQELADEGVFHANVFEIVRRIEEEHGIFKLRAQGIGGEK